jgi:integrase
MDVVMGEGRWSVRWVAQRGCWEIDARPHGRIRGVRLPGSDTSIPFREREWAEEVLAAIERDITSRGLPVEVALAPYLPGRARVSKRLSAWLDMLQDLVDAGDRSPTYLRELRRYARKGGEFEFLADRSVHDIQYGDIEDWMKWLRERGLAPTTVANVVSSFRTFMGWLARRREIGRIPEFPPLPRSRHRPRLLTLEEQDRVLEQIPVERRGIYLAMTDLMIRPGEARALNVGDYDWDSGELRVYAAMKGLLSDAPRRGTKEDDFRLLGATGRLSAWLDEQVPKMARLNPVLPLFRNPNARAQDRRYIHHVIRTGWNRAVKAAGLEPVALYEGTKHSTASALINAGVRLEVIQAACGHADRRSTERYAKLANEQVRAALLELRRP